MLARLTTLLAGVIACVAALLGVVSTAAAGPNGGIGYRVDGVPGSKIEGGFIQLRVAAGRSATGYFYATNTGNTDVQLSVYAADGLTGDTTGIVYSGLADARRGAGAWMAPSTRGVLLRADDSRRIDFSVLVPSGARPGDHVGGIVLEQRKAGSTIRQVVRNVVPVLVDVDGPAASALALRSAVVRELPGTSLPAVVVRMVNTGRRICRPSLTVALTGPGERGSAITRTLDAILPGDSVPYPFPWPRSLAPGNYTAVVTSSGCGAPDSLRTDVRSDTTAENDQPRPGRPGTEVLTNVPPGTTTFTPPRKRSTRDRGDADDERSSGRTDGAAPEGGANAGPPTGASGTGDASTSGGKATQGGVFGGLARFGDVAIEYLPSLLQRLLAPLSLLGLLLLFLFAQETFDRKDPKLALAPVARDPDLAFLPLDQTDLLPPDDASGLEVVGGSPPPRPAPA